MIFYLSVRLGFFVCAVGGRGGKEGERGRPTDRVITPALQLMLVHVHAFKAHFKQSFWIITCTLIRAQATATIIKCFAHLLI